MRMGKAADLNLTKPARFLPFEHGIAPPPPSAHENPALHDVIEISLEILLPDLVRRPR